MDDENLRDQNQAGTDQMGLILELAPYTAQTALRALRSAEPIETLETHLVKLQTRNIS